MFTEAHLYDGTTIAAFLLPSTASAITSSTAYVPSADHIEKTLAGLTSFRNTSATVALGILACHRHQDYATGISLFQTASADGCQYAAFMLGMLFGTCEQYRARSYTIYENLKKDEYCMGNLHAGDRDSGTTIVASNLLRRYEWLRCFLGPTYSWLHPNENYARECENPCCINRFYLPNQISEKDLEARNHGPHWNGIVEQVSHAIIAKQHFVVPKAVCCFSCDWTYYCSSACRTMDWLRHKGCCGPMERVD